MSSLPAWLLYALIVLGEVVVVLLFMVCAALLVETSVRLEDWRLARRVRTYRPRWNRMSGGT